MTTYTLDTLLAICGDEGEKITLPMDGAAIGLACHGMKEGGVWLKRRDARLFAGEQEIVEWHPRHPYSTEKWNVPALPAPFTAHELAAFYSDGGGSMLRHLDARLMSARDAREAHVRARWLCRQAERLHGPPRRETSGRSMALQWLLNADAKPRDGGKSEHTQETAATVITGAVAAGSIAMTGSSTTGRFSNEPPKVRQARRLVRFRSLGGEMQWVAAGAVGQDSWHCRGVRGALAKLSAEEKLSGRPMSDKSNVRADLARAIDAERSGDERGT